MSDIEDLIRERLARHGVIDIPSYAGREIDWIAGKGQAPDHEDGPRGPALGAAMADTLLAGEMELVDVNEHGKLVFVGTGRTRPTNRLVRRRPAHRIALRR